MAFALVPALMALAIAVPPATAYIELEDSGDTGFRTVTDEPGLPGVFCRYKPNGQLNRIGIRQLHTHSTYTGTPKTWVGFRLQITRNLPPFNDNKFVKYRATPLKKARANDSEVAFFKANWKVPAGAPNARYRAVVHLFYYEKGSKTKVEGKVRGRLEVYRRVKGTMKYEVGDLGSAGFCAPKWVNPPIS